MPTRHELFITCAPGLEPLLHAEVRALKLAHVEQQVGGVFALGTMRDCWRLNLELRTAIRVLRRVARFQAHDQDELYRGVQSVDWSRVRRGRWHARGRRARERLDAHPHPLPRAASRMPWSISSASARASGRRSTRTMPMSPSTCISSRSAARCWSTHRAARCTSAAGAGSGRAPLAETLAAAVVLDSRWGSARATARSVLRLGHHPDRGGAARGADRTGVFRQRFGFERWPDHDAGAYAELVAATRARCQPPRKLILEGSDASAEAIAGARANAAAAGVAEHITFRIRDARDFSPRRGWNAW
ncbi:MAG: hypothetical protein U1E76_00455 [Planctomycetota bacterium]